jgi:hypothetical protein
MRTHIGEKAGSEWYLPSYVSSSPPGWSVHQEDFGSGPRRADRHALPSGGKGRCVVAPAPGVPGPPPPERTRQVDLGIASMERVSPMAPHGGGTLGRC